MALVNVTCAVCTPANRCAQCASIAKALRAAGHAVTETSRYDALRAALAGSYGFDACVLAASAQEQAVVDAASVLLTRPHVALIVDSGSSVAKNSVPNNFTVIEKTDWDREAFPTDWIGQRPPAPAATDETQTFELPDTQRDGIELARRRVRSVAQTALRGISAAGFPEEPRLELLATLEDEIAWAKMSASHFGIVLLHVPRDDSSSLEETKSTEDVLSVLERHIHNVTRKSDVFARSSDSLLVVLPEAALDETELARQRIRKAARKAMQAPERDSTSSGRKADSKHLRVVTVGSAVYPTHGMVRATLLARATASAIKL